MLSVKFILEIRTSLLEHHPSLSSSLLFCFLFVETLSTMLVKHLLGS